MQEENNNPINEDEDQFKKRFFQKVRILRVLTDAIQPELPFQKMFFYDDFYNHIFCWHRFDSAPTFVTSPTRKQ